MTFNGQDLIQRNHDAAEMVDSDRRGFLRRGGSVALMASLGILLPGMARAEATPAAINAGRAVRLSNMHTGERFTGTYWANGRYLPDAFASIKSVMRDQRSNETYPIDPRLMDILFVLQNKLDNDTPFKVFSGYRSPASNAWLRNHGEGVAKNSLHMTGQAIDIALPGTNLKQLHQMALNIHSGGVGYYPQTGFVHVDTGRVRTW